MAKWLWTGSAARRWCQNIPLEYHNGGKEERIWNTGYLLVLLCPVIKVNGKLQAPNSGRTTNGLEEVDTVPCGKDTPRGEPEWSLGFMVGGPLALVPGRYWM